jgi:hypothetical protein
MSSHWRLMDPKATLAGDCFAGARIPRPEVATKDDYKTARVTGQLEAAQDLHQIVNLAPGGGPARFKVLLHTQTSIESQDHTG